MATNLSKLLPFCLYLCFQILYTSILGQEEKIDSIFHVYLKANSDTAKVKALFEMGNYLDNSDPDSALLLYEQSRKLMEKNYKADTTKASFYAKALNHKGIVYLNFGKYQQMKDTCQLALEIASIFNDKKTISHSHNLIGLAHFYQGQYSPALENFQKSLKIKEETGDRRGMSNSYTNMGLIFDDQGNYPKAIEYYMKSLEIKEETGDKKGLTSSYTNIGVIFKKQGNYEKALEYFNKVLVLGQELKNKRIIGNAYTNIGVIYREKGELNTSIEYLQKSITIYNSINDLKGMGINYSNMGVIYMDLKQYNRARVYFLKSLDIKKQLNDQKGIAISLNSIAWLNNETKKYDDAIENANLAFNIAKEIGALPEQLRAVELLTASYKSKKDFEKAFAYQEEYIVLQDSIHTSEKSKAIIELEARYQTEKKEEEIIKQQLLLDKQKVEIDHQQNKAFAEKIVRDFLIGIVVLALIALFFIFKSYRLKKKANNIISQKNDELEQANTEILMQRAEIEAQRDMVVDQKKEIERVHEELTGSIRYAQQIQMALLPSKNKLIDIFDDHFVFFKPRDIVSGDFYWATQVEDKSVFCIADCTGHGVPGAFMSMLGISLLNQIVQTEKVVNPVLILERMRNYIIHILQQEKDQSYSKDGMDVAVCVYDKNNNKIQYSGANVPLFIISENGHSDISNIPEPETEKTEKMGRQFQITEIKPDKMPIGIFERLDPFTGHEITIKPGTCLYLVSDGITDQFGGDDNKRFTTKRLRELLLQCAGFPLQEQRVIIEKAYLIWKKTYEQLDDATIVGVKL